MITRDTKHKKAQLDGRMRDGKICQICGSTSHTEGHHAMDFQFGGKASVDNIITLCHDCHTKVHSGKIDVFVFD